MGHSVFDAQLQWESKLKGHWRHRQREGGVSRAGFGYKCMASHSTDVFNFKSSNDASPCSIPHVLDSCRLH